MPNRKDAKYYKPDTQQNVALRQMKLNIALVFCTAKKKSSVVASILFQERLLIMMTLQADRTDRRSYSRRVSRLRVPYPKNHSVQWIGTVRQVRLSPNQ